MHRSIWALTVSLLLAGGVAHAQDGEVGTDEVTLKNGGLVRGTVVQIDPGHEVVILVVGDKEPRHLPWSQVADVVRGRAEVVPPKVKGFEAVPEPSPPNAAPKPQPAEPPPGAPSLPANPVALHVESDDPDLRVYQPVGRGVAITGNSAFYVEAVREVCRAPCDEALDGDATYYFGGPSIASSANFRLSGLGKSARADVDAGSTGGLAGGITLATVGGASVLTGVLLLALGSATTTTIGDHVAEDGIVPLEEPLVPGGTTGGVVLLSGGVAMLAGGVALAVVSRTTFDLSPVADPSPADGGSAGDAAAALPFWASF